MNSRKARDRRGYQKHSADALEAERGERKAVLHLGSTCHNATSQEKGRMLAQLQGKSRASAFEGARWVWQNPDPNFAPPLIGLLSEGRRPFNRAAAAYALQALGAPKAIPALERVVSNQLESPAVRGYAAEALAHFHRSRSHRLLIRNLRDRSKHVRFWCAFALGEMCDREATSILQELAETDKLTVPGFHTVAKEAQDALRKIGAARHRFCPYCIGRRHK